jgi:uncharacterized membrane protein YagU involved in acid resistance
MKIFKPAVLGGFAGLTATFLMTKFQEKAQQIETQITDKKKSEEGTPSTVRLADKISQRVVHHPVQTQKKELAGNIVHYGFGTSLGILYGTLNEAKAAKDLFSGLAYGIIVWVIADNILVPLMGLSKGPFQKGVKDQAYALTSHLVYGGVLAKVLRGEKQMIH